MKRESEIIVKSDFNINANTNIQYKGAAIVASLGAGFSYANASSNDTKTAQNYSREVVSKAVSRVQTRTSTSSSVTQIFENRELNRHSFDASTENVSGIYRWLDKKYQAQLYNYGKRMMFEFILPEPAALYVELRLRAFEASLNVPQPPPPPQLTNLQLSFRASEIDEEKFDTLRSQYDLSEFTYPMNKNVVFVNTATNEALFKENNPTGAQIWYAKTFNCTVNAAGYQVMKLMVDGSLYYPNDNPQAVKDRHLFQIQIDGTLALDGNYSYTRYKAFFTPTDDMDLSNSPCFMANDNVILGLGFQNILQYELVVSAQLQAGANLLSKFQSDVYRKIQGVEQQKNDAQNNDLTLAYKTALATYKSRIADLQGTLINDLLQGRSEAANADVIRTELKRQCLSFLTKEFDADASDDLLTDLEAVGERHVSFVSRQLTIHESADLSPPTTATMDVLEHAAEYPLPALAPSQRKGRYVQFLEQAFEWQELSWIFYPYFWATPSKWVDLINRSDTTDPSLSAFLQAGSTRVLLAVTPAYCTAVLHFLATREPWDGGPSPVVGDPLFIPLYEEIRNQQDDLANAVPEGDPWTFRLPTSLVYLENSSTPLPAYPSDAPGS